MARSLRRRALRLGTTVGLLAACVLVAAPAAQAQDGQFFDSNGVQIHYVDQGEGEPVILMHGLNMDYQSNWFDTGVAQTLLDAGYRVLALDARAHGKSGGPHDPAQYGQEMARDIVRLMDHAQLDRAHVVGYSMGAGISAKLRDLHPERLTTLTLGGGGWIPPTSGPAGQSSLADALERGEGFVPLYRVLFPDWSDEARQARSDTNVAKLADVQATVAMLRAAPLSVTEESLRANTVPTLAIVGGNDPAKQGVDALGRVMSRIETVVIPGADHLAAVSHSDFSSSLLTFLKKHHTN
jgi:pimeloyl-ACP methyl ester carboxylesterase